MNGLLGRLRLWQKLAILGLLGMVMALPSLLMYMRTSNEAIGMAAKELAGIAPSKAVLRVIQLPQQHRGLSAGHLGGNASVSAQRQQKQAEVNDVLAQTGSILEREVRDQNILQTWTWVAQTWESVAKDVSQRSILGSQSFARHTTVIATYLAMLDRIADYFGLSLDPAADSRALTMAVLFRLPSRTESPGSEFFRIYTA